MGCWNVRTTMVGLSVDLRGMSDVPRLLSSTTNPENWKSTKLCNRNTPGSLWHSVLERVKVPLAGKASWSNQKAWRRLCCQELTVQNVRTWQDWNGKTSDPPTPTGLWSTSACTFLHSAPHKGRRTIPELCTHHYLCSTDSLFQTEPQHTVSWRRARLDHHKIAPLSNVLVCTLVPTPRQTITWSAPESDSSQKGCTALS